MVDAALTQPNGKHSTPSRSMDIKALEERLGEVFSSRAATEEEEGFGDEEAEPWRLAADAVSRCVHAGALDSIALPA